MTMVEFLISQLDVYLKEGLTYEQIGNKLGTSKQTVSNWLTGKSKYMGVDLSKRYKIDRSRKVTIQKD
ncbi:MAG: hypothetical protein PHU69_02815 [Fermentimonas sp.]|nr:hypothetical protein [Fermentimonas sp.]